MAKFVDMLRFGSHGMAFVNYSAMLHTQLSLTVRYWQEFCALPLEVKQTFLYTNDSAGFGYEFKTGAGRKRDKKENFDVTNVAYEQALKILRRHSNPTVPLFVLNTFALVRMLREQIYEFAEQLDVDLGMGGIADEVDNDEAYFVRFIHYFEGSAPGDELANAHVDQSGMTFHLYESDPGFQCLSYSRKKWRSMDFKDGYSLVIPNMQMQLWSEGAVKAMCHRVVASQRTAKHGRFSAVCFVQFPGIPKYDKSKHGRLQEKNPGFNYNMPFNEFQKLFK
jgi:isopenicillin N synthase-like dioxygenase